MEARRLYLDTTARAFVSSPDSTLPSIDQAFFDQDVEAIELYFLKQTGNFARPYDYVDYSGNTVKMAVGTTVPAALFTAFSALTTAVTITSSVSITGGAGVNAVQRIEISPRPATGTFVISLPTRNVTVSSIASSVFSAVRHGLLDGQSVTLTAFTITSGFSNGQEVFIRDRTRDTFKIASTPGGTALTVDASGGTVEVGAINTASLPENATPQQVQSAFVEAGLQLDNQPQITVTGEANDYLLTYADALAGIDMPTATVVGSSLAAAPGLSGTLNLNTTEVADLLANGLGESCTFEVETSANGFRQTYQMSATIAADIIASQSTISVADISPTEFELQAPNGTVYAISVTDNGALSTIVSSSANAPTGLTLISPNLTRYQITVDDQGILTTTDIT